MHKLALPAILAAAAIAAAGCADTSSSTGATDAPAAPPAAPAAQQPAERPDGQERTELGNLAKEFGEKASIGPSKDAPVVEFTVGEPSVAACEGPFTEPPENGRFLELPVTVQTFDDPENVLTFVQFGVGWEHVSPDGQSIDASTFATSSCGYEAPSQLRPNRSYEFPVIVDVPEGPGVLVLQSPGGQGGWEWQLQ